MKVCINALYFNPGQMGGVETYLRELVRQLPASATGDAFAVFVNPRHHGAFSDNSAISVVSADRYEWPDPRWFIRGVLRRGLGIDVDASNLAKVEADVIHYPFTVMAPWVIDRPAVLSFWDMQHEYYPEYFSKEDLALRAKTYKKSAQHATRIIVSSAFTKGCLVERYLVDEGKIDVVYAGYAPDCRVILDQSMLDRARESYGLDRPFIFYPAATWPHKNHGRLLDALKLLIDRWQFEGTLVLSGIAMQQHNEVLQKIHTLALENNVKILGYVPYVDLPYIYAMARLLVFPSLFEGFGMPLVEAMASGCPVVASDITSIPEVLGGSGKLFDPTSAEDIAATVWNVWNDEEQLAEMSKRGLDRVTRFRWEETAHKTLDVYHKAV